MDDNPSGLFDWGRFGFLIADLFTALTLLFLVATTVGNVSFEGSRVLPKKPQVICGIDNAAETKSIAVNNDQAVRAGDSSAIRALSEQLHTVYAGDVNRTAGLVEVGGGSSIAASNAAIADGTRLADGTIQALKLLGDANYVFSASRTSYQSFYISGFGSNQVQILVFYYRLSGQSSCGT